MKNFNCVLSRINQVIVLGEKRTGYSKPMNEMLHNNVKNIIFLYKTNEMIQNNYNCYLKQKKVLIPLIFNQPKSKKEESRNQMIF